MEPQLLRRYGGPVPRYTSYPTAPHFHPGVTAETYLSWLGGLAPEAGLSLYLHVPFCRQMCWYCGCHTKVVRRYQPVADYAETLLAEARLVAAALPRGPRVVQLHWGGGTPTILSGDDLRRLTEGLRRAFRFDAAAETAVEVDPRNLDAAKAEALADIGVTRASLGVQDFNPAVQKAINRIQPYDVTARAVARLRSAGIQAINFDLMYGLPKQWGADLLRSVDLAAGLAPDRISLFGYAHVPWMKSHQRLIAESDLPDGTARWAQSEAAAARLQSHGYLRIGLDHFVRPEDPLARAAAEGRLRRNFQGYTDDPADALIGLGASAIGSLPQGYVQNAVPLKDYREAVHSGCPAVVRGCRLSDDDRLRRAVIENLMCRLQVDLPRICARHGADPAVFDAELSALQDMAADGLVELEGGSVRVTEAGRPLVRSAAAVFDGYLKTGTGRHSRAV